MLRKSLNLIGKAQYEQARIVANGEYETLINFIIAVKKEETNAALSIYEKLECDTTEEILISKIYYARYEYLKNNYEKATELIREVYETYDLGLLDGMNEPIGTLYHVLGTGEMLAGNQMTGLDYLEKCLQYRSQLGKTISLAGTLNNLGVIHHKLGNNQNALKYFNQSYQLYDKFDDKEHMAMLRNNIGDLLSKRGETKKALGYHKQNEVYYRKNKMLDSLARCLSNITECYRLNGNYDKALEYIQQSVEIREQLGKDYNLGLSLYTQINLLTTIGSLEKADKQLDEFYEIAERVDNKTIWVHYKYAKACYHKQRTRLKEKSKAQKLYNEIIQDDIVDHDITIKSIINLIDLLFFEFLTFNNEDILDQASALINNLFETSKVYNSYHQMSHALILRSKLDLILGDFNSAEEYLEKAKEVAQEQNMAYFEDLVEDQLLNFEHELKKWLKLSKYKEFKERKTKYKTYLHDISSELSKST